MNAPNTLGYNSKSKSTYFEKKIGKIGYISVIDIISTRNIEGIPCKYFIL